MDGLKDVLSWFDGKMSDITRATGLAPGWIYLGVVAFVLALLVLSAWRKS